MKNTLPRILRNTACALALAFGAASAFADYSSTLSALNPQGYWKLNEFNNSFVTGNLTNTGTAGTAVNGVYYFTPLAQQEGALGAGNDPAMNFNGLNQYTETPYNPALNPAGPFTVEFWAKLTNATSGAKSGVVSRYITVPGGPTGQFGYLFFVNNGNTTWQFRVYNGTGATTITSSSTPAVIQDTWYHVVGVYDGSTITIYVDGQATTSASGVVYAPNTNSPTRIGAGTPEAAPTLFFPGLLDNVAIYHSVLTPDQIYAHYNAATTNAAGYNAQILAASPAVYYPMNEPTLPASPVAANSGVLGSAYNGAYVFGVTNGVAGPRAQQFFGMTPTNNATDMNGTSGRVIAPPLPLNTDSATYTCWVKRNGSQVSFAAMMFTRPTATGMTFDGANRLAYTWNDAANTYNFNSGLTLPDGVWTFCAASITPTNAILYLGSTNGLQSATNAVAHSAHDFSTAVFNLGWDSGSRYFKGTLDEAAFFDTSLDYATISNLFYSATPAVPLVTRTPSEPATIYEGMTVSFTAYGVATGPLNYQWRKNGANLGGQTASTLNLVNVNTNTSGNYDVVLTFGANSVTSASKALTVVAGPPIIAQQPASATRYQGAAVTFSVGIQGSVPWSFQWSKGGTPIPGATSSSYTIANVTAADATNYNVTITNPLGSTNSAAAALTVLPSDKYAAQVAYSGARAYWQMNEKSGTVAYDYVGGLNCNIVGPTITNNVTSVRPPTYAGYDATNTCFAFQGGNTSDGLVTPTALTFTNTSITVAAWVMPYAGQLAVSSDVNFPYNVGGVGLNSAGTDGKVRAHPLWGSDTGLFFSFDTWNYIVVVWTPSGQTFYLDNGDGNGLRSSSVSGTVDPANWQGLPFYIGRQAARTDRGWPGQIDEVALFDRALTAAEVSNLYVAATSGPVPPSIVSQPASQAVLVGNTATFTVGAIGAAPITYQWSHAGTDIPGATSRTLTIPNAYYTDAGSYSCGLTNSLGGTNSSAANLSVFPTPQFANLTNALVLHLKFDGNALDSSGRTNNGTFLGETNYDAGKLGQAYHYKTDTALGIYNYMTLGTPGDLQFGATNDFSVAYWVKFTGAPGDLPFFCSAANSYGGFGFTFAPSYGGGGWSYYIGGVSAGIGLYGPDNTINDGTWHSLVHSFTRTGNAVTYLDGVLVDTRSMTAVDDVDSGLPFSVGQDPSGYYQESGEASIDDLGVWRRALTPPEALAIYTVGQNYGKSFDTYGPVTLGKRLSGGNLELIWQAGTLESAPNVEGPYNPVVGATAPFYKVPVTGDRKFYRVKL